MTKISSPGSAATISSNRSFGAASSRSSCSRWSPPRNRSIAQPAATYQGVSTPLRSSATRSGRQASHSETSGSKLAAGGLGIRLRRCRRLLATVPAAPAASPRSLLLRRCGLLTVGARLGLAGLADVRRRHVDRRHRGRLLGLAVLGRCRSCSRLLLAPSASARATARLLLRLRRLLGGSLLGRRLVGDRVDLLGLGLWRLGLGRLGLRRLLDLLLARRAGR